MELLLFRCLIAAHIAAGATGAIAFWIPVVGRKGDVNHRKWGRIFTKAILITGCLALTMSLLTLYDPMTVHPHLVGKFDADFVRGMFGVMMLHNAILTLNLAWYGWLCVQNRRNVAANRTPLNVALQFLVMIAAVVCAWDGARINQPLMMLISVVGMATGITNLLFLYGRNPSPVMWLKEHVKALVGAGISVYTAFLAFGSVRLVPSLALHPAMWSVPLVTGLIILIYHRIRIDQKAGISIVPQFRSRRAAASD
ncbi:hypothetical protein [Novosphingobium sp.]|uniref:hypothetical protein n=1 Tax=Novosphingobium sp. TaxID=1874826 RepID=UPI001DEFCC04|nr:hypothetical protein [Novosphingobium sp.]MBX9663211.1 hypothetical protein [Novosphingobium sp.]